VKVASAPRQASSAAASLRVASKTTSGLVGSRANCGSSKQASSSRADNLLQPAATAKKLDSSTSLASLIGSGRGSGLIDRQSGSQVRRPEARFSELLKNILRRS